MDKFLTITFSLGLLLKKFGRINTKIKIKAIDGTICSKFMVSL